MTKPPSSSLDHRIKTLFETQEGYAWLIEEGVERSGPKRRITDVRWSSDGRRLLCCAGLPIVLTSIIQDRPAILYVDNPAGSVRLTAPDEFKPLKLRPAKEDAISADFDAQGRVVTAWLDGTVRAGLAPESPLITTERGIRWVRCAPTGTALALVVGRRDAAHAQVHVIHTADDPAGRWMVKDLPHLGDVAWSPDGHRIAIRSQNELIVADVRGDDRVTIPVEPPSKERAAGGRVAWTSNGIVTAVANGLAVVSLDGSIRIIDLGVPQPVVAAAIAASPNGRFAAVALLGETPSLVIVDLLSSETASVPWVHRFDVDTSIAFAADALAWGGAESCIHVVPWGEAAEDTDRMALDAFQARCSEPTKLTNDEIAKLVAELKGISVRQSLVGRASSFRNVLEDELKKRARVVAAAATAAPVQAAIPFDVGDKATHAKFGDGSVTAVDGRGDTARVTIEFADGPKTLQAKFLKKA